MDQYLVAAAMLVVFFAFAAGYFIGASERKSRKTFAGGNIHSGPDDVETRSRRAF